MPLYYPPEPQLCSTQGCPHEADPPNSRGLCPRCCDLEDEARLEAADMLGARDE